MMTEETAMAAGVAVLERAIAYALGSLASVTPALLNRPTPCIRWSLRDLLHHLNDSMSALQEAADHGRVTMLAVPPVDIAEVPRAGMAGDPDAGIGPGGDADSVIAQTKDRAVRLLGAWTNAPAARTVRVAAAPLSAPVIAGAGAIEVTTHGWDVAQACRVRHPVPEDLADELLDLALLLIRPPDRPGRFAAPRRFPEHSPSSTRLLAYLGRTAASR
jgi:uncharacterized protein (TIGR03086 family)